MPKQLYIAEKPSVARQFADALHENMTRNDGFLEGENAIVTWCVGHLVTMSYPEVYDPALKRWTLESLPFLPDAFLYEVLPATAKQFGIVKKLLHRGDVDTIYVCTDSGREGEYIYRLVEQMAGVKGKTRRRVWIDSQTEEEILRGIREARPLSEYDHLADAAYLRAKEDYLMGINFSRLLSVKYGQRLRSFLNEPKTVVAVGRVMTCVLGMVVRREREIRSFVKTPFYRLIAACGEDGTLEAAWKAVEGSRFAGQPGLYKDVGFLREEKAKEAARQILEAPPQGQIRVEKVSRKQEKVQPPLLFNLAELQNVCSKVLKKSPDETLAITQELYEKKLVTYPRTDARVLSSAIAKEIHKNLKGLTQINGVGPFASKILEDGLWKGIGRTRYTNDKQITDHYAIIPTGQGLSALAGLAPEKRKVYEMIVRRFLAIFYPPAVFKKTELELVKDGEHFFAAEKTLQDEGFMQISGVFSGKKDEGEEEDRAVHTARDSELLASLKAGSVLPLRDIRIRAGETSPPRRYTSGSMILAMENAGQLIEDEEMRAQIKGSGIGTSATRAEILKKLVMNRYLSLQSKTQVIAPTLLGEMIHDTVFCSIRSLLNPELTANWEMGLSRVAEGQLTEAEYMEKLRAYVSARTENVKEKDFSAWLLQAFEQARSYYPEKKTRGKTT